MKAITIDSIITVAGWEPRFLLGMKSTLSDFEPRSVEMFFFKEYEHWSVQGREELASLCQSRHVKLTPHRLAYSKDADAVSTWKCLERVINRSSFGGRDVLLDITTMPRDVIWSALHHLEAAGATVSYVYYKPESYSGDWLSRDPHKPRLLFKHSGVALPGRPTALIAVTGFDVTRTEQLVNTFEPKIALLGVQPGVQFGSDRLNAERHRAIQRSGCQISCFTVDAYSEDLGLAEIERHVLGYRESHNVLLSSLGPKLSGLSLFQLNRKYPEVGLVYTPSNELNREYSSGLGQRFSGTLPLKPAS